MRAAASQVWLIFGLGWAGIAAAQIPPPTTQGLPAEPPPRFDPNTLDPRLRNLQFEPFKPPYVVVEKLEVGGHTRSGDKSGRGSVWLPSGYTVCTLRASEHSRIGGGSAWKVTATQGASKAEYTWKAAGGEFYGKKTSIYFNVYLVGIRRGLDADTFQVGMGGRGDPPIVFGARCGDNLEAGKDDSY